MRLKPNPSSISNRLGRLNAKSSDSGGVRPGIRDPYRNRLVIDPARLCLTWISTAQYRALAHWGFEPESLAPE